MVCHAASFQYHHNHACRTIDKHRAAAAAVRYDPVIPNRSTIRRMNHTTGSARSAPSKHDGVIVHLFEWSWDDIANECEQVVCAEARPVESVNTHRHARSCPSRVTAVFKSLHPKKTSSAHSGGCRFLLVTLRLQPRPLVILAPAQVDAIPANVVQPHKPLWNGRAASQHD